MKKLILVLSTLLLLASCASNQVIDIKSPCVSSEGGPCGSKRPINDWWLKNANS